MSVTLITATGRPIAASTMARSTQPPRRSIKRRASQTTSGVIAAHTYHSVNAMPNVWRHWGGRYASM